MIKVCLLHKFYYFYFRHSQTVKGYVLKFSLRYSKTASRLLTVVLLFHCFTHFLPVKVNKIKPHYLAQQVFACMWRDKV